MITSNYRKAWFYYFLLLFSFTIVNAQTIVTAIVKDSIDQLNITDEIKCIRFTDFSEENVMVGMKLEPSDELISSVNNMKIEITAGENTSMIFSGRFRLFINKNGSKHIAIDLLNGEVNIQTEGSTSIESAHLRLGSESTKYALKVERSNKGIMQEVMVFDGLIIMEAGDSVATKIPLGIKYRYSGGLSKPMRITENDAIRTSKLYASIDIVKALNTGLNPTEAQNKYAQLQNLHKQVIVNPEVFQYRKELAEQLNQLLIPRNAIYNLNQAEKYVASEDSVNRAQIYMYKGISYEQLNQKEKAEVEYQKAERINPKVMRAVEFKKYRVVEPK